MKICLAASSGGHLTELLCLRNAWKGKPHFFVITNESSLDLLNSDARAYMIGWGNRRHPFLITKMLFRCIKVIINEKPDVLISTGAAVGCILGLLIKITGGKVIWIETISHTNNLTMSGYIIRPFAHLFFVQWPELLKKYPGVTYAGKVI